MGSEAADPPGGEAAESIPLRVWYSPSLLALAAFFAGCVPVSRVSSSGCDKPELFHPSVDFWEHRFYKEYGFDKMGTG